MRDFMDEERARRFDEMYEREYGTEDVWVWLFFGVIAVLAVAGLLDNTFGWGVTDWLWSLVGNN